MKAAINITRQISSEEQFATGDEGRIDFRSIGDTGHIIIRCGSWQIIISAYLAEWAIFFDLAYHICSRSRQAEEEDNNE
jgi:hypothetical protein